MQEGHALAIQPIHKDDQNRYVIGNNFVNYTGRSNFAGTTSPWVDPASYNGLCVNTIPKDFLEWQNPSIGTAGYSNNVWTSGRDSALEVYMKKLHIWGRVKRYRGRGPVHMTVTLDDNDVSNVSSSMQNFIPSDGDLFPQVGAEFWPMYAHGSPKDENYKILHHIVLWNGDEVDLGGIGGSFGRSWGTYNTGSGAYDIKPDYTFAHFDVHVDLHNALARFQKGSPTYPSWSGSSAPQDADHFQMVRRGRLWVQFWNDDGIASSYWLSTDEPVEYSFKLEYRV